MLAIAQIAADWAAEILLSEYREATRHQTAAAFEQSKFYDDKKYEFSTRQTRQTVLFRIIENGEKQKTLKAPIAVAKPSILATLISIFKSQIIIASFMKLGSDLAQIATPLFLGALIRFISTPSAPLWRGVLLAFALAGASLGRSLAKERSMFYMFRVSSKLNLILKGAVYKKASAAGARPSPTRRCLYAGAHPLERCAPRAFARPNCQRKCFCLRVAKLQKRRARANILVDGDRRRKNGDGGAPRAQLLVGADATRLRPRHPRFDHRMAKRCTVLITRIVNLSKNQHMGEK